MSYALRMQRIPYLLMLLLLSCWLNGQEVRQKTPEVIASAGAHGTSDQLQIDWTMGEFAVAPLSGGATQWTQGFHQGEYEVLTTVISPERAPKLRVFPNPTNGQVTVASAAEIRGELVLFDASGRQLIRQKMAEPTQTLQLSALPPGLYFLHFTSADGYRQVTQIQKF